MKKVLLSLFTLILATGIIGVTNAEVTFTDLFNGETPLTNDAYKKLLTDCDCNWGYSFYTEPVGAVTFEDDGFIFAKAIVDTFNDNVNEYRLFISPYTMDYIKGGGMVDKTKFIIKEPRQLNSNDFDLQFYISSGDVDLNTTYYAFIVPLDMYDAVGTPAGEVVFNINQGIAEYEPTDILCQTEIEHITLKSGLNSFSTPAVIKSISFSNGGNNISFAKMVNGRWTPVTFNNSNVKSVIRPLDGFIVRNSNNSDVTMTIVYDRDIDINDALHQKQLDAGWNFLGITKTNNPFGTIANAIVSDIIDFTAGKTNKIDLSNLRDATSFMLGKAYGVFVNNSNGIYGGINNSNAGPNATLVNNLTKTVVFVSNETSTKRVFKGKYTALKDKGSFINTIHIQNADGICYDNCPISGKIEFCFIIKGDEYCESFKDINNVDRYIKIEDLNLDINESVDIVVNATYEGNYGTGTKNFKIGLSENYGFDGEIWEKLAPIKIADEVNDDTFSVLTTIQEKTVYLKASHSKLAEFIIKPNGGKSTILRELTLEIDGLNQEDNIRLMIDDTEYEPISSNDGTITYQPDEQIPSEGVPVKVILEQELPYEKYTIGVNIKSINEKSVGKTFSKRFVSALVYISKQENMGDYTKFTLGVDKYDDNYSIETLCMLTGSSGAGVCLLGENRDDGPFEDGYTFNVLNSSLSQPINYIIYLIKNSDRNGWADSIKIERKDYPDYFKVNGVSRKIFSNNNYSGNTQCIGMDMAGINHTINGDKITLKWSPVDGDEVEISVFDPEQEKYLHLGTVDMIEGEFTYTKKRNGEHNFILSNECKQVIYKIDA